MYESFFILADVERSHCLVQNSNAIWDLTKQVLPGISCNQGRHVRNRLRHRAQQIIADV